MDGTATLFPQTQPLGAHDPCATQGYSILASILYIVGLFGVLDFFPVPERYATAALAVAGGLLILGALLRDL
jgi:hypothetical protein